MNWLLVTYLTVVKGVVKKVANSILSQVEVNQPIQSLRHLASSSSNWYLSIVHKRTTTDRPGRQSCLLLSFLSQRGNRTLSISITLGIKKDKKKRIKKKKKVSDFFQGAPAYTNYTSAPPPPQTSSCHFFPTPPSRSPCIGVSFAGN